jgi:hypothetical protein
MLTWFFFKLKEEKNKKNKIKESNHKARKLKN